MIRSSRWLLKKQWALEYRSINFCHRSSVRSFTSKESKNEDKERESSSSSNQEWRKVQLDKIEKKFQDPLQIDNYEDVQPMWKEMESRVVKRRTLTVAQRGGKSGRINVRKTDEEEWLQAGLYDTKDNNEDETFKKD
mmetsp:Transcript_18113/g.25525  ORF Transcript_18113/g.25525 Transcript_18113/m.25525 type:complete len:137 (+) Transcript_18113:120-530(+)